MDGFLFMSFISFQSFMVGSRVSEAGNLRQAGNLRNKFLKYECDLFITDEMSV